MPIHELFMSTQWQDIFSASSSPGFDIARVQGMSLMHFDPIRGRFIRPPRLGEFVLCHAHTFSGYLFPLSSHTRLGARSNPFYSSPINAKPQKLGNFGKFHYSFCVLNSSRVSSLIPPHQFPTVPSNHPPRKTAERERQLMNWSSLSVQWVSHVSKSSLDGAKKGKCRKTIGECLNRQKRKEKQNERHPKRRIKVFPPVRVEAKHDVRVFREREEERPSKQELAGGKNVLIMIVLSFQICRESERM